MKRLPSYLINTIFCVLSLVFLVSWNVLAQDWNFVDVLPGQWSNEDIKDVYFINGQGWAVGSNGIIVHTHNGVRWHDQVSGVVDNLYAVYFPNTTTGWAVGERGTILYTEDSGCTWEQQVYGNDLFDVYFVDERYGWIVGRRGQILYTDNAGLSWKIAVAESSGQADLNSIFLIDTMNGWAVGDNGEILHWNGADWIRQTNPSTAKEDLNSVWFNSATDGWIVGENGIILHTSNGGSTWVSWSTNAPANDLNLNSIYFLSGQTTYGWIVGEDGLIMYTRNSGGHWFRYEGSSVNEDLYQISALNENDIWAVGNDGGIFRSPDRGQSWGTFANPNYGTFWDVSFDIRVIREGNLRIPDPRGWIVGDDGVILKLLEDGATWQDYQTPTERDLYSVHMVDKFNGLMAGVGGTIARTTDGVSWCLDESVTGENLYGVCLASTNNGWAVGDNGTICYWNGINWSLQSSNVTQNLRGVHFIDESEGWVVGEFGTILRTNNGGFTWIRVTEPGIQTDLLSVYFHDGDNGWFVGDSGVIFYMDSGEFVEQDSSIGQAIFDVDFIDEISGWCSSVSGTTIDTANGGDAWNLHVIAPILGNLYGIDFADQRNGVTVGSNATIMRYTGAEPIAAIELQSPQGNIIATAPTFEWETDNINLVHTVFIDDDNEPYQDPIYRFPVSGSTTLALDRSLEPGTYYWGVEMADGTFSTPIYMEFTIWPPTEVTLSAPSGFISEASPTFSWNCNNEGLSDQGLLTYTLYIDDDGTPFNGIAIPVAGDLSHKLSSTDPLPDLTEGEYIWGVTTSGLEVVQSNTFTFTVDISPPTGTIVIDDGKEFTNSLDVALTLTASDTNGVGVAEMQFSNNGTDWSAPEAFATAKDWSLLLFGGSSGDGEKTVYARYSDNLGHWMAEPITSTITVDTVPPVGAIAVNDGAEVTGLSGITLSLSATDDKSGMDGGKMVLSNDGVNWSDELLYVDSRGWDFSVLGGDNNEGIKTVYARYRDLAGNWMAGSVSDDIELDKTGPIGTIIINNGDPLTDSALVDLTLAASDKNGIQSMKFTNGSGKWSLLEPFSTTRENWDITASEYGGNGLPGTKNVYVRFVDSVGNESSQAALDDITYKTDVTISVEISAPEIEGKIKNNDIIKVGGSSEPNVSLSLIDVLDDAGQSIELDLSGIFYDTTTGQISGSFPVGELTAKTIQLKIDVEDALGNQADATSNILTVDNDPPASLSVSIDQVSPINYTSVDLAISATGATEMYVDGDIVGQHAWIPYAEILALDLTDSDGTKEIGVKFRDDMGNESEKISNQIIYDTTPPTGTIQIDSGGDFSSIFIVSLNLSASDEVGTETYQLSNDGNTWSNEAEMTSDEIQIASWSLEEFGGDDSEGEKTVYARYKDKAGNMSDVASDSIIIDTSAPDIRVIVVKDKQEAMQPVSVTAIIESDRPLTAIELHYREKGDIDYTSVIMTQLPDNWYTIDIPGQDVTLAGVEYYISAYDGRYTATHPPKNAAVEPHSFTVVDTERPVIEHDHVKESSVKVSPEIIAKVTDAVGLDKVSLFYRDVEDRGYTEIDMATDSVPDEYSAFIPAMDLLGDVMYYIEAVDTSGNSRTSPSSGVMQPYKISFVDVESPEIAHTNISDGREAGSPVLIGATVTDNMVVDQVILKYKSTDKEESIEIEMPNTGAYYSIEIPGDAIMPGEIEYSIIASDGSSQSEDTEISHSFTVVDTTPPSINLTFAPSEVEVYTNMYIEVEVTDNVEVAAVSLNYKGIGDLTFNTVDMVKAGKKHSATIAGQERPGEVKFYVYAADSYGGTSTEPGTDPQNVPRVINVIDISNPIIEHSPVLGVQEAGSTVTIAATVTDNVQISDVSLHYRTAGAESFKLGTMARQGETAIFSGDIPESTVIIPGVEYYIRVVDSSSNVVTHPSSNPDKLPHSFSVHDTVPPEIVYDPGSLSTVLITESIIVMVEATDLVGIREMKVFYRSESEAEFTTLVGEDRGSDQFSVQIPSPTIKGTIYYYIQVEDNSGNIATSPADEPESQPYSTFVNDPFPPLAPTRLTANSAPGGRIMLTWEPSVSADIDRYNIYTDSASGTIDYSTIYDSVPQSSLPDDSAAWESPALGEGTYRFVVRSVDKSGNEEQNTSFVSAKADATKPDPATNIDIESLPGGRVKLTWTLSLSKDAAVYNIYWDNAQLDINYSSSLARVSDPGIMWTSEKLRDGVVYRFVVRCEDNAGNEEENSDFVSARADATPPDDVTGLTSTSHKVGEWSNQQQVTARWTAAIDDGTGLAGYSFLWDISGQAVPDEIMDIGEEISVTTTLLGSQYFHIRAVDKAGNWSGTTSIGPFNIDITPPQAPTNLRASPQVQGRIELNWGESASNDVASYNIYRDDGSGRGIDYSQNIGTATGDSWTSNVLDDGTTYQFGIRAEDRAGNEEKNTRIASVVADAEPPSITHKPIDGMLEQEILPVAIEATVTDASGLDSVKLHYRKRGSSSYMELEMNKGSNNSYKEEIPASTFSSAGVDYYISASDTAGNVAKHELITINVGTVLKIPIDASEDNDIVIGDGMTIHFPIRTVDTDRDLMITIPKIVPEPQEGLKKHIITRELQIDDDLNKSITFTLPYDRDKVAGEDELKLSLYLWNGQTWDFLTKVDPKANQVDVTTMKLGIFSIIGDYEPPSVSDLKPSGYTEPEITITARIEDGGSGIDPRDIGIQMNGQSLEVPGTAIKNNELVLAIPQPLQPGDYTIQLTVGDNVGNKAVATTDFQVVGELLIEDVYCYPNPFRPSMGATFAYTLTEPGNSVNIRIFGMDGKLVRILEGTALVGQNETSWDGKDEAGDQVLSSVYICHIEAEGPDDTVVEIIRIAGWE